MNHVPLPENAAAQVAAVSDGAVRAGPLVGIPQLLRDLDRDPAPVFATAGIDPHMLDDPESTLSFTVVGQLLDTCANATGCPHFGLLLGQRDGLECLGLVGMLARHSPTPKHALRNIVMHLHLHDRGAVPTLSVADGKARLAYTIYQPGVTGTRQIYDLAGTIGSSTPTPRPLSVPFIVGAGLPRQHGAQRAERLELRLDGMEKLQFDTFTATYVVVEGDDLIEIAARLEVSVDELKARGKLTSDKIEVGRRLAIPAGTTANYGGSGPVPVGTGFPVTRAI